MRLKKITINNPSHMMVLWVVLAIEHPVAIYDAYLTMLEMLGLRSATRFEDYSVTAILISIYITTLLIWKMATFTRSNFISLTESLGVKFRNKHYYYSLVEVIGVYSFARGFWDNIYIAAKIDVPFFAFAGHRRVKIGKLKDEVVMTGGDTPDYMKEESRIELFSLIEGPYDIDVSIKIEGGKGEIPVTGCQEIDELLKEHLAGVTYYNAKLLFDKTCLRLAIIGGSWEGRRFGEKIQKSFEMFKQLDNVLKIKYPIASWDKYQVKWNRSEEVFYLIGQ